MRANGTELPLKSTVDLSCWLNRSSNSSNCDIVLLQNHSIISSSSSPKSSIRTQILLNTFGKQTFECKCKGSRLQLICGIYVFVGIAPDQPKNVSCAQYGKYGRPICAWDKGYYTYLITIYTLWVANGTALGEKISTTDHTVDLREKLDFETTYTIVVEATNKLGSNSSEPMQFTLIDIVKPHPPVDLSVRCDAFAPQNCTILWQDPQETQCFRLRYQPIHSNSWITLENLNTRKYDLHGLQPKIKYEFQVSCRLLLERGLWSDWSPAFQTEAVPFEPVDVWYLKKEVSSKMQNITLFWKSVNVSETISKNFCYQVIFQNLNQMPPRNAEMSMTTHTAFSHISLKVDYNISLNSKNSRGVSPSVYIATKLGITELLPPNQVSATFVDERIVVKWKAPSAPSSFINGYVVEWVEVPQDYPRNSSPTWFKIPVSNSTVIKENLKPNICYHISVFALYQARAGKAAVTTENISSKAPLTGPQIVNVAVKNGSILVSWREVPEHQRMGCITSYKIYLQKQFFSVPPDVHEISKPAPQPFRIKNIEAGASYVIWMTASTNAGESPKGNEELIYIKTDGFKDVSDRVPIVAIFIIIGLSVFICCVPIVRQKIFSLFSALVFGWYPDPANSTWAKEFTSTKDESSSNSTEFLSNPVRSEDPETLQIKEALIKRQCLAFMDVHIFKNTETEGLSMRTSNCNSLTTNIKDNTGNHQLPSLYKKFIPADPNESQVFSECLVNPLEDATVDYLPTITPAIMTTEEDSSGSELSSLPIFPITSFRRNSGFLGGKLTLDAIKMDCNFFTENPFNSRDTENVGLNH
ncbi:interleukin-12 receptor subunit beta-2 [Protobothrops mucrosquamatus]|uniref:interleukin-12 receptor subunit beta-2 n=1 Tax=Protobothrops mucrosquamatus TaxID=103944 RepID=UPI0010FBA861|nr:interleukin-12 receptor subunit beta-2 [Protobothrops mucrosquamatus]